MRWNITPPPKEGDIRYVKRFAFFPRKIDGNVRIWWEHYYSKERYLSNSYYSQSKWYRSAEYLTDDPVIVEQFSKLSKVLK